MTELSLLLSPVEYSDLQRIKRELALQSKLYTLYSAVTDSVSGYYDIQWADLNIEKINTELQDFQNRFRSVQNSIQITLLSSLTQQA